MKPIAGVDVGPDSPLVAEATPPPPPAVPPRYPFRLTRPGLVYLAVLAFVALATFNSANNLLYIALGILAGAFLLSLFLPALCLKRLDVHRVMVGSGVAGELIDVEYQFRNRRRTWPCLAIRFVEVHPDLQMAPRGFILHIPRHQAVSLTSRMVVRRRGILQLSEIRVSCSFPFGFVTRTVCLKAPQEFVIYPRIGVLNRQLALRCRESVESGTMTSSVRGGSDEFYGVREYRAGDNMRAIHWRSTARMRRLMIRELAANAPPQMIVVLNLRGWRKDPRETPEQRQKSVASIEQAIELTAALLCYGFIENFAVGLAIAGEESAFAPSPTMGREARAQMLRRLAILNPEDIREDRAVTLPNRLAGRAQWIVVTLHADDPWGDLVASRAAGRGGRTGGGGAGGETVLAGDAPEVARWVRFLTGSDAQRFLRDPVAPENAPSKGAQVAG